MSDITRYLNSKDCSITATDGAAHTWTWEGVEGAFTEKPGIPAVAVAKDRGRNTHPIEGDDAESELTFNLLFSRLKYDGTHTKMSLWEAFQKVGLCSGWTSSIAESNVMCLTLAIKCKKNPADNLTETRTYRGCYLAEPPTISHDSNDFSKFDATIRATGDTAQDERPGFAVKSSWA